MGIWSSYQEAIFANIAQGKGHTVVLARAGSGKTTTIMEGLKHVPPKKSVLLAAFNRKIADELSVRAPGGVEVSTLHSYGLRQVKSSFGRVSVDKDKLSPFIKAKIGDSYSQYDLKRALAKAVSLCKASLAGANEETFAHDEPEGEEVVTRFLAEIDAVVDAFAIDTTLEPSRRHEFVRWVFDLLRESGRQGNVVDFDDMVWLPVVRGLKVWQYDRVFVDETQDLNAAQIELAMRACKKTGRILCVGDDRQAIYGFRGADSNAVQHIIDRLKAKVMKLTVCYRCASSIVALAAETVPDFEPSPSAIHGLIDFDSTSAALKKGAAAGDFVLSRANAPLVSLCWQFLREGRPATIQGRDFAAHLTGMIAKARKGKVSLASGTSPVGNSVENFLMWLDDWSATEIDRLRKKDRDTDAVTDKVECLYAIAEGCKSLDEVAAKCEQLFGDADDDTKRIVLSSTHKAKGLERDRVWVLADTYLRRPGIEEQNLWYVAVTRAKAELYLVRGIGGAKKVTA